MNTEITQEEINAKVAEIKEAISLLPKATKVRLIGELTEWIGDIVAGTRPDTDPERYSLIRLEAGTDTTVWSEELSKSYDEKEFSATEELVWALYAVQSAAQAWRTDRRRRRLQASRQQLKASK
ncbi:MAG: hypothetical protein ACO395_04750 [Pontimonas sp.]